MRALLLVLCAGLCACSGDDEDQSVTPHREREAARPLPECPDHDYSACDVAQPECQQRLMALAACVKGAAPIEGLQIDLLSEDDYAALVAAGYDEPEPPVDHFEQALSGLSLHSPTSTRAESIAEHVQRVAGVYRTLEDRIVLIDHGRPADSVFVNSVFIHEAVHALQDADYDLASWPEHETNTLDSRLARNAVVEGEASFYEARAIIPMLGLDFDEASLDASMKASLKSRLDEAFESPWYSRAFGTFPYGVGGMLAYLAWLEEGPAGTDRLFASPPTNTRQLLAQLLDPEQSEIEPVEIAEPVVPAELTLFARDTLGAWGLNLFLSANGVDQPESLSLALDWRGDRFTVYADEPRQRTYALWQVELANETAAAAVERALPNFAEGVEHDVLGRRVFVSIGAGQLAPAPIAQLTDWGQAWLAAE